MHIEYEVTTRPKKEHLKVVERGLDKHNLGAIGKQKHTPVASFAKNRNGTVVGGIYGCIFWDWLYIDWLWVKPRYRGKGIGGSLLQKAEELALSRGVTKSHLCSASFQSVDFYLKHGYKVFGELEDMPRGETEYYFRKSLG